MKKFSFLILVLFLSGCFNKNKNKSFNLDEYSIEMLQSGYLDGTFTIKEVVIHYLTNIENLTKNYKLVSFYF